MEEQFKLYKELNYTILFNAKTYLSYALAWWMSCFHDEEEVFVAYQSPNLRPFVMHFMNSFKYSLRITGFAMD